MLPYIIIILALGIAASAFAFRYDSKMAAYFAKPEKREGYSAIRMTNSSYFIAFLLSGLAIMMLFLAESREKGLLAVWVFAVGLAANFFVTYLIKFIARRKRPNGRQEFIRFTQMPDYSFPSSHASVAFAAFALVGLEYSWLKLAWLAYAVYLSFSRLYLEEHFLSDVIAGIVIGLAIGLYAYSMSQPIQLMLPSGIISSIVQLV